MRSFANWLSPHNIRVNAVHPTGVAAPMVENDVVGRCLEENPQAGQMAPNLMPVGLVDPVDISNAILYFVSDDGRRVALSIGAEFNVRCRDGDIEQAGFGGTNVAVPRDQVGRDAAVLPDGPSGSGSHPLDAALHASHAAVVALHALRLSPRTSICDNNRRGHMLFRRRGG